uniref:Uncharacterized protein n=1 Tax=Glossina morsitans morsitans TaxID=37546 RepID=A0A1B0FMB6_GLOMM
MANPPAVGSASFANQTQFSSRSWFNCSRDSGL